MTARRKTVFFLVVATGLFLSPLLGSSKLEAASPPTSVEIGIWLRGAPQITPIKDLEREIGVKFKAVKWYENWDDSWRSWIPNGYHANGYQPEMTWQPMLKQPDGSYKGVANEAILAGQYDQYLDQMSANVKALPYRLRVSYAAEFNGTWNPWAPGKEGNTPANFRSSWRYIVDRFNRNGATNVDWIWAPNIDPAKVLPRFTEFYPGDAYVTYFGLDGYNFGTTSGGSWQTFRALYQSSYDELQAIAGKDIYITEIGSVEQGGSKAEWIKDMFNDIPNRFPKIKSLTWWHVAYPQYDMRITTSGAAAEQFALSVNGQTDGNPTSPQPGVGANVPVGAGQSKETASSKAEPKVGAGALLGQPEPTESSNIGFLINRVLKAKSDDSAPLVAAMLLTIIALLTSVIYLFTKRVLRRAARYGPA